MALFYFHSINFLTCYITLSAGNVRSLYGFFALFLPISIGFNPLVPSAHKSLRNAKILILKLEGIIKKKKSYERRDYQSVDERAYLRLSLEKRRKQEFRH